MTAPLSTGVLAQLFTGARTHSAWLNKPVEKALLQQLYDLMKWAPTSASSCPLRIVFITSPEAKERLKPCLDVGNVAKTMQAPVTAILAYDTTFYDHLPVLFPHTDARSWFTGNAALAEETAFRNSSLQGGYFILAARSLGLDCGPMSGFDRQAVDRTFLQGTSWKSNFLCNLGYGDTSTLHPRNPRLDFDTACRIL